MMLFKNCRVYAPEDLGTNDVWIAGGKILAIQGEISLPDSLPVQIVDAAGLRMMPGLIDGHVHIAGAGGEGGPATRTPEIRVEQLISAGVTTVIGLLGTDGVTRSVESVLMKTKALRAGGLSAWMFTGAYRVPPPTICGSVARDIALIDEVIGVGEVAIADHRSSNPSVEEIIRLALDSRVGGMLGGKGGVVNLHVGEGADPFEIICRAVQKSELSHAQFLPTHCNRTAQVLEAAKVFGREGYVDVTASSTSTAPEISASRAIAALVESGVPLSHITMSSDACGSIPEFDEQGNLLGLEIGQPKAIFDQMKALVTDLGWPWKRALQVVTSNVADILKLPAKGRIAAGNDADLILMDEQHRLYHVIANGAYVMKQGQIIKRARPEDE